MYFAIHLYIEGVGGLYDISRGKLAEKGGLICAIFAQKVEKVTLPQKLFSVLLLIVLDMMLVPLQPCAARASTVIAMCAHG